MSQSSSAISGGSSADGESGVLMRLLRQGHSFSGRERNCCFLNTRGAPFADVSAAAGWDLPDDGRAIARVDWDCDGALDFWIQNRSGPQLRLLANRGAQHNHFLKLRMIGNGRSVNRDAIGTRVEVLVADEPVQVQTVRAGDGFLAQSTKWLHFGLGAATQIEQVTVRWPNGDVQDVGGTLADQFFEITQGEAGARRWKPPADVSLPPNPAIAGPPTETHQLVSALRVPLPNLQVEDFSGVATSLITADPSSDAAGRFVLLNLWASWCQPCLRELAEFKSRATDLREAGIEVVALSTDRLGGGAENARQAVETANRLDLPFRVGFATESLVDVLQIVHNYMLDRHRELPAPTSLLIDSQGRLVGLYRGAVAVERLLEDAATVSKDPSAEELRDASVPFAGRWLARPTGPRIVRIADALFREGLLEEGAQYVVDHLQSLQTDPALGQSISPWAESLLQAQKPSQAQLVLRAALEVFPDMAAAHLNLGVACERLDQFDEAQNHYQQALQIDPSLAIAHVNLASLMQQRGDHEGAARELRQAIEKDPNSEVAHMRLAVQLAAQGDYEQSEALLRKVTTGGTGSAEAHFQLGILLEQQDKLAEAADAYRMAIGAQRGLVQAHVNLGGVLARQKKLKEATTQFRQALELDPDNGKAHFNLGMAYQRQKQPTLARKHLEHATRVDSKTIAVHFHLAGLCWQMGDANDAIASYERVLQLDPQHGSTQNNLAWILAVDASDAIRDGQRAVLLAEAVATVTKFQRLDVLSTLGAAYAEAGRFDDAVRITRMMRQLAQAKGNQAALSDIEARLLLYSSKKPYRNDPR